jgi:hypothetical protein
MQEGTFDEKKHRATVPLKAGFLSPQYEKMQT